jgi:multidrug efflux pump subunit AcrA (membrane-fusion protein)
MKRKTILLIALFAVFSGAKAYLFTDQNLNLLPQALATEATVTQPTAKPALTVTVAQPQTSSLSLQLAANGNIAAWQEALVGSQSNGLQLREVRVNVGDVVPVAGRLCQ